MKLNKKVLAILSIGHLITDINQGALPALLPFFKDAFHLSYTITGTIPFACNLASSIIQPVFGHLSDRRPMGWLIPLAPFVACLGLSVSGLFSNFTFLMLSVMVMGIGIAGFHPEGFKTAYFFTGEKKATGMSIFAVGGNLGIALGPMTAVTLVSYFGLKGLLGYLLPGIAIGTILLLNRNVFSAPVESLHFEAKKTVKSPLTKDQKTSFSLLVLIGTIRAWAQFGMLTYIPFYYIDFLKGNPLYVGKLVSTYLLSGVLGTLIGSPLADRWGHKKFLVTTLLLSTPLFILFYNSGGLMVFITLGLAGMVLTSTFALSTVMAQELLPQNLGMASGMMVGFTMSAGALGLIVLGLIADHWGVPAAMKSIFVLPLIAFGLGLLLKYPLHGKNTQSA